MKTCEIALFDPGDDAINTIALHGADIVVPLEMDLDDDPLQDDEVRLHSADGHFEQILLASDADVTLEPGGHRLLYRFRDVPRGVYTISVRISDDEWATVLDGVLVSARGIFVHDQPIDEALDDHTPVVEDEPEPDADPPESELEHNFYEYSGDDI